MINKIGRKVMDYLFARDIYAAHLKHENKVRETVLDSNDLSSLLKDYRDLRLIHMMGSSTIPNLIECLGAGLAVYANDLPTAAFGGMLGETFRLYARKTSIDDLKKHGKLIDLLMNLTDFLERINSPIQDCSDRLDNEGEEWKK